LTTRQIQALNTRKRIFYAAMELLETKNIDEIKIIDITRRADVSTGLFYRYYKTKWDVFLDSYGELDNYFETVVEPLMVQENAKERILCFFDQYVIYHTTIRDIHFLRILYSASNTILNKSDYDVEHEHGMLSLLKKTVQYGVDKGEIRLEEGETVLSVVSFLMITTRGLIFNWCTENGNYDLRKKMQQYLSKILRIL